MTNRMLPLAALLVGSALALPAAGQEFAPNNLFVGSQANDRVVVFDDEGGPAGTVAALSLLQDPNGVAFGPEGLLWVTSNGSNRVYAYDATGQLVRTVGTGGGLTDPRGLAIGPDGNLYIADAGTNSVFVFTRNDQFVEILGATAGLDTPTDLAFSADGHLYVASSGSNRIHEFDPSGASIREIGEFSALSGIGGLALSIGGWLYASSTLTDTVIIFNANGNQIGEIGFGSGLDDPVGLTFGPDGDLYVVSRGTSSVFAFDPTGQVTRTFGTNLATPTFLAFAPFRFAFTSKGSLVRDGELQAKIKQTGTISVQPGAQTLMLFLEPPKKGESLLDTFGAEAVVLPGYETFDDASDRKRTFYGAWIPDDASDSGIASLTVAVSGKVDKNTDYFQVKKAKGTFLRAGEAGVFIGSAVSGKLLK